MRHGNTSGAGILAALLLILVSACTTSSAATSKAAKAQPSPSIAADSLAGGCAGTVLTESEPPAWAQAGWTVDSSKPWPVPWALGTNSEALAYVFAGQLVAGVSPRADGSNNKVLWLNREGSSMVVVGRPIGKSQPVVTMPGGPSITDVPAPGCWSFTLSWTSNGKHTSTVNLDVLPAGTLPH